MTYEASQFIARPGLVGVNREEGAQAGLRDAELCRNLGPAPPLVQDQLHQQPPRQPKLVWGGRVWLV